MKLHLTESQLRRMIYESVDEALSEITDFGIGRNMSKSGRGVGWDWIVNGDADKIDMPNYGARLSRLKDAERMDGYDMTDYDGNRVTPEQAKEETLGLETGLRGFGRRLAAAAGNKFGDIEQDVDNIKTQHVINKGWKDQKRRARRSEAEYRRTHGGESRPEIIDTGI